MNVGRAGYQIVGCEYDEWVGDGIPEVGARVSNRHPQNWKGNPFSKSLGVPPDL